jgi:carbonic anhydrase/acetyltransferase-like protein (isoleucine patch superfamily)
MLHGCEVGDNSLIASVPWHSIKSKNKTGSLVLLIITEGKEIPDNFLSGAAPLKWLKPNRRSRAMMKIRTVPLSKTLRLV